LIVALFICFVPINISSESEQELESEAVFDLHVMILKNDLFSQFINFKQKSLHILKHIVLDNYFWAGTKLDIDVLLQLKLKVS